MSIFLLLCVAILVFVSIRLYILWTRATERLRLVEFVASRQEIDRQREKISDELDALICQKTPVERVEDSHEYESGEPQAEPEPETDAERAVYAELVSVLQDAGYSVTPPAPQTDGVDELVEVLASNGYSGEIIERSMPPEPEPESEPEPKKQPAVKKPAKRKSKRTKKTESK